MGSSLSLSSAIGTPSRTVSSSTVRSISSSDSFLFSDADFTARTDTDRTDLSLAFIKSFADSEYSAIQRLQDLHTEKDIIKRNLRSAERALHKAGATPEEIKLIEHKYLRQADIKKDINIIRKLSLQRKAISTA